MTQQLGADAPRIVIVSGIRVRSDAISNIMCRQRDVLVDAGYHVDVIVQHRDSEPGDWESTAANAWDLLRHPAYVAADLVIFHFGIYYDLFSALVVPHPHARRIVHFHNVTPPDLLSGATRGFAQRGLVQLVSAEHADTVWSDSPHNSDVLAELTTIDRQAIVPMAPPVPSVGSRPEAPERTAIDAPVRLISVGRFVPAKGLSDLVAALALLDPPVRQRVRLTLAGSVANSDTAYFEGLTHEIAAAGLTDHVDLAPDLSDSELAALLWRADLLVSASHHEGFCVPVIEAIATECRVIVTDAGALPDTVGPCGTVVPVADPRRLADAIAVQVDQIERVRAGESALLAADAQRLERAREHLEQFSEAAYRERTLRATEAELAKVPAAT